MFNNGEELISISFDDTYPWLSRGGFKSGGGVFSYYPIKGANDFGMEVGRSTLS